MGVVALPHAPSSATVARHHLVADLRKRGLPAAVIADAELVLAEMVGNAVRHARPLPDGTLCAGWEVRGESVVIRVTDGGGATRPTVQRHIDVVQAERGRGLAIVAALARAWGAEPTDRGLRTWAHIDVAR